MARFLQPWTALPYDSGLGPQTNNFLRWLQTSTNYLIGSLFPLPAPTLAVTNLTTVVLLNWDEVPGAAVYQIFETTDRNPPAGDPIAVVPANFGGPANSFLRSGISDGFFQHYYWVRGVAQNGTPGALSAPQLGTVSVQVNTGDPDVWPFGDPAVSWLMEDFHSGPSTLDNFGNNSFQIFSNGGASKLASGQLPHIGVLRMISGTTANTGQVIIHMDRTTASSMLPGGFGPLFKHAGWKLTWIFRFGYDINTGAIQTSKARIYIGLCVGSGVGRPQGGIFLRWDTDPAAPAISDTTLKFEHVYNLSVSNTQGTVVDTGKTPDDQWHRLTIRSTKAGEVKIKLENTPEYTFNIGAKVFTSQSISRFAAGYVNWNVPGSGAYGGAMGDTVTVTNAVDSSFNGTFFISHMTDGGSMQWLQSGPAAVTTATVTMQPVLVAFASCVNDTQASPANKILDLDYCSFLYSPFLSGGTPPARDQAKARFYSAA